MTRWPGCGRRPAAAALDCVFDCSGNPAVIGQLLRCARRGGTVALLGLAGGATAELPVDLVTLDELDVLGIRSSPNAYPAMIALLASGAIRTEPLTTHVYPLSDVATAFDALARREAIRPILTPEQEARRGFHLHPGLLPPLWVGGGLPDRLTEVDRGRPA